MRIIKNVDKKFIARRFENAHDIKYINWQKEATKIALTLEEYNEMKESLDQEDEVILGTGINTVRSCWHSGSWSFKDSAYYVCAQQSNEYVIYDLDDRYATLEVLDAAKKEQKVSEIRGGQALGELKRVFAEKTEMKGVRKDWKFSRAFGSFQYDNEYKVNDDIIAGLHNCDRCNGPFIWADDKYDDKVTDGVQKADISSAYPAAACGLLPTTDGYKMEKGYIEPNEEYRFAFYLKSGHVAEYKRFNTREDQFSFLFRQCRNPNGTGSKHKEPAAYFRSISNDEEVTLLMRASQYKLDDTIQYFYDRKKDDPLAKEVLVKAIGALSQLMQPNKNAWFKRGRYKGFISIIVHCRHNHKMIELYREIAAAGGKLISIQTDAMTWLGKQIPAQTDEKVLGAFVTEIVNGRVWQKELGVYCIEDNLGHSIIKYQGIYDFPIDEFKKIAAGERMNAVIKWYKEKEKNNG